MKMMKAAIFPEPKCVQLKEVPIPQPGVGEVLLKTKACAICGSDKWLWQSGYQKFEDIQGHEGAGEVVQCGPGVTRFKPGDRVAILCIVGCGKCRECLSGNPTFCEEAWCVTRQYAEYSVVPERSLVPVPDDIPFELACLITDSMGTPARAVLRSEAGEGDLAAVLGCGPIGLNCIQLLRAANVAVVAVDPEGYRREMALQLGAYAAFDPTQGDVVERIYELTEGGADFAFECSGKAGREALRAARRGGTVAFVGECPTLQISPSDDFLRRQIELFGTWYLSEADYYENINLVRAGRVDPRRIVTHTLPFAEIARGFELFVEHKEKCIKVVLHFDG